MQTSTSGLLSRVCIETFMVTFTLWLRIRGEETQKEAGGTPKSKVAVNRSQPILPGASVRGACAYVSRQAWVLFKFKRTCIFTGIQFTKHFIEFVLCSTGPIVW